MATIAKGHEEKGKFAESTEARKIKGCMYENYS